jgi:Fe-S cluster biogenesis protein NfuA
MNSFGRRRVHLCDSTNEDVLIELAGAATCSSVDVASQNVLELKP